MRNTGLPERGVALLITLAFIVMITIILVGFAASMRTDRPAASSFLEKSRAAQYAQSGVETVVAALQQYAAITSGTAGSKANWISQPGQLTVSNTNSFVLANVVPLSSGSSAFTASNPPTTPIYQPAELNIVTLSDPTNKLITNASGASMKVKWIYVRQDGTLDASEPPLVTATNPIMGRYAYWTDDESSRVNYNIAWKRGGTNTDPSGVPTNIDLTALSGTSAATAITGAMADAIHSAILGASGTNYTFFNSPEDARQVTIAAAALQANEFEVTHYNHDPNTTFFNQPRIVLTTHPERAGWTFDSVHTHTWIGGQPYLQILSGTNTSATSEIADPTKNLKADPGNTSNIDANKLNFTIYFLMSYLQRTDWPMVTGSGSIQSKYFSSYPAASQPERLAQLAISIIDYVRCKESAQNIVPPLRATHLTPGTYPVQAQISTNFLNANGGAGFVLSGTQPTFNFQVGANQLSYMGVPRSPCVTEMASWKGLYSGSTFNCFSFELYLPKNYGIPFVDLSGSTGNSSGLHPYLGGDLRTITAADCAGGSTILNAGSYLTVTYSGSTSTITGTPATIGVNTSPRFALALSNTSVLTGGGGDRLDIAPLNGGSPGGAGVPLPSNPTAYTLTGTTNIVVPAGVKSTETDDPRVDKHYLDWHFPSAMSGGPNNTFGAVNFISTLGKSGTTTIPTPEQDTDASGKVTDASLYLPAPAGSAQNLSGMVTSVGELGYICTGIETAAYSGTAAGSPAIPPGTPWRTLRLQPNRYTDTTVVPDWAFIDLFTAPAAAVPANAAYVYAPRGTTFGGRVNVNSLAVPFGMQRILPLAAVLQGCGYDSTNAGATLSPGVALTTGSNIYNRTLASNGKLYPGTGPPGYISPGEICEIKGIADGGEGTEELVREVSNLYTTRGDVFTVYTVGQALKQTPAGTLVLTGEQRLQAMVERYVDSSGAVHFAPVYFRNLTP